MANKLSIISKIRLTVILITAAAVLLCGCGSTAKDGAQSLTSSSQSPALGWDAGADAAPNEEIIWETGEWEIAEEAVEDFYEPQNPTASSDADGIEASQRKLIKNRDLSVETIEYDSLISELSGLVSQYGGYIQDSTQNGSSYYDTSLRSARFTIRIPAERFDEFTGLIGDMATVTYSYEYIDDVTASYIDLEARLKALKAEQESYLRLMEMATTVDEILSIQSYLSNVNYQIESFTAQLKSYDSLISYSTLSLSITEVERITKPAQQPGVFERIGTNLSYNLASIGDWFVNLFVGTASALPYLAIAAVIILILWIVVKAVIKRVFRHDNSLKSPERPENKE